VTDDRDRDEAPVIKVTDKRRFANVAEAEGPERPSASGSDEPGAPEASGPTDELAEAKAKADEYLQHLQRLRVMRPLLAQPARRALAIDRVHPGECFGNLTSLVRLHPADEVPRDWCGAERGDFRRRFLQITLAEIADAATLCSVDSGSGLLFADGDDCDAVR